MDHESFNQLYLENFLRDLNRLEPFLNGSRSLSEESGYIAQFLDSFMPIAHISLIRLDRDEKLLDNAYWGIYPRSREINSQLINSHLPDIIAAYHKGRRIDDATLSDWILSGKKSDAVKCHTACLPVERDNRLLGFVLFFKDFTNGDWTDEENNLMEIISTIFSINFSTKQHMESAALQSFVFNGFMDNMRAFLYVTDPKTDKILFMNSNMKKAYGLCAPEGKICYEILGRSEGHRCSFCPIEQLLSSESENPSLIWEEIIDDQDKVYENYDSLMRWTDGSTVHFQHSIDITESKLLTREASMDELTDMFNRRAGKSELEKTLAEARKHKRHVSVCMFDINSLKKVNDSYGHSEGDFLISVIASTVKYHLRDGEYPFRLSGDEFIVVFPDRTKQQAEKTMEAILSSLRDKRAVLNKPYDLGFCYGVLECWPDEQPTVGEILRQTDARMYEAKRKFHIVDAVRNMTDNPLASVALGASFTYDRERLYDALVRSTDDYIFVCNMKSGIFHYPPSMVEEFPLPGEFLENATAVWERIVHPEDKNAFLESYHDVLDGRTTTHSVEYRALNRKDEWVWLRSRGYLACEENGTPSLFAGIITNLGKKNKIDHTTGLFNKHAFELAVNDLLANRPGATHGIMLVNIDEFRRINDLYNREYGDEVLRVTAHKLQAHLPENASMYRMDGDEFAILFRDSKRDDLKGYYDRISKVFSEQQEFDGKKYFCTVSAGSVLYPMDAINYLDLTKYAGYALEFAKDRGKGICYFFSMEIMQHKTRELELIELLRESVERDYRGFSLNYQPQVDAVSKEINGAEALVRWSCEEYGALSPVEFIPLLEKSGLIYPVGRWIFRNAVEACRKWIDAKPDFSISINLSYLQLVHPEFIGFVRQTLEDADVPARNIIVEVTESKMASNTEELKELFKQLRSMGVKIAMDDFGTGYSSLDILKMSPADIVKIDRAFVRDILHSSFDATFIKFIVALCHDVDIRVCLEGVESMDEYAVVEPMELDMIQGYLFGRPLSEVEFIKLMDYSADTAQEECI